MFVDMAERNTHLGPVFVDVAEGNTHLGPMFVHVVKGRGQQVGALVATLSVPQREVPEEHEQDKCVEGGLQAGKSKRTRNLAAQGKTAHV